MVGPGVTATEAEEIVDSIAWVARESAKINAMPSKPVKKQQYTYRCAPQLRDAAMEKAHANGEDLSEIIRRALARYVEGN